MIQLIDQSDPEKLKFHCDRCDRTFVQATRAFLDLHIPNPGQDALKIGIPPCQPLPAPIPAPIAAAAPRRARKPKAETPVAPPPIKTRKRKPKVATA